ncbi:MAG: hypothetical protein ACJAYU_000604 [Bradymonadia bacterium]|jgi:hypothetical protein
MVQIADKSLRTDLVLAGTADTHRTALMELLASQGWAMKWDPAGWGGIATRGNRVANVLFGAFAQYHELRFGFVTNPDGTTGLTVFRTGDGCMGGIYGMYKVKKSFKETSAIVEQHYVSTGALLSSSGI